MACYIYPLNYHLLCSSFLPIDPSLYLRSLHFQPEECSFTFIGHDSARRNILSLPVVRNCRFTLVVEGYYCWLLDFGLTGSVFACSNLKLSFHHLLDSFCSLSLMRSYISFILLFSCR